MSPYEMIKEDDRWALYPPGRVPAGVTVHVNEEDGDVNIDSPSSLQWWLDVYPLLADHDPTTWGDDFCSKWMVALCAESGNHHSSYSKLCE
ncbi:F-box protein [Acorus gramineus]|uniref:F-box protein n=1 Tax=Acorus gramineus TaxID=55184 RepID=A0AAV9A003_ACOGR|nr:F-box protein [Acorus gramineus]